MTTIKKSIICKNINDYQLDESIKTDHQPKAGDVAIFEVLEIGSLNSIQNEEGRNCSIFEGDRIMVTFGNRYASNQFEGYIPEGYQEVYDLLGKGGVAGIVKSMYYKLELLGTTKLKLVGYATDRDGEVINTIYNNVATTKFNGKKKRKYKMILSIGSSMDSGKTTSAAYLCRGLKAAGHKVAFFKLTGTVFNKDKMLAYDCGADFATDFADFGFPSTYLCSLDCLRDLYAGLLDEVEKTAPGYVVIEIADGLLQRETEMLINDKTFMSTIDHVLFSCGDSLSALQGVTLLRSKGIEPFGLSGMINTSPLLVDEVNGNLKLPLLNLTDLASKNIVNLLKPKAGAKLEKKMASARYVLEVA